MLKRYVIPISGGLAYVGLAVLLDWLDQGFFHIDSPVWVVAGLTLAVGIVAVGIRMAIDDSRPQSSQNFPQDSIGGDSNRDAS